MISFGGQYTRKQWRQGIALAMYPTGRGLVLRMLGLAIVLGWIGVVAVSYLQGETPKTSAILRTLISVVILACWALLPYFHAWHAASAPWRTSSSGPSLKGVVTGEGIASNAFGSAAIEKWDTFLRAQVREEVVVLVGADGLATVLPRTFFATEDDWRGFRQLVEFNVVAPH